jgi:hypothetical protein
LALDGRHDQLHIPVAVPPVPTEEEIGWAPESVWTLGSLLKLGDFTDIVYVNIHTFWTGFIPRTLSVKSLMSYNFMSLL